MQKRAPHTHSVAAITLVCPRISQRFPPLPGQPVSRPARSLGGTARTPRGSPRAPLQPPACSLAASASTPYCCPHAPRPPVRSAAAAAALVLRGRRSPPRTPPTRPAAACAPCSRPQPSAAARAPHGLAPLGRPHAPRPQPVFRTPARLARPCAARTPAANAI